MAAITSRCEAPRGDHPAGRQCIHPDAVAETLHTKTEWRRELLPVLTEQNVLLQLQHLKTHPSVAAAMAAGELTVSGWVYDIGKGEVRIAEDGQKAFTPITE